MADKLVLIDLSGIAHPIYHMTDGDANPNATSTAIVERIRAMASAHPHVAICCDSGRSFRHDIDPDYKGNRKDSDKDAERARIRHQIALAEEILRGDGFPVWSAKGFEADDLIASAVEWLDSNDSQKNESEPPILIISPDKDLRQLVTERVEVLAPANGDSPAKTYDAEAVYLKHGVTPNQLLDYFALVGDASDNIKGATGIGEKTAAKLITKFGTLEDLYAAVDAGTSEIKPGGQTSLAEFRGRMDTVRSLIRLRTDAPIPFEEIFRERVPQDVAVFGGDDVKDDIDYAMPTLESGFPQEIIEKEPPTQPVEDRVEQASASELTETTKKIIDAMPPPRGTIERQPIVDLAPIPQDWKLQLEPRSIQQAKGLAESLFLSRNFGAYGHPAGILATILAGRELGIQAMASLRAFHIVDNKPTMAADFIRARVLSSGLVEYFRPIERTSEIATFAIKRKGDPEVRLSYTIEEAKASGRVKPGSGYAKDPADLLVARASAKLARLVCPEITFGMYAKEEFNDD